MTRSVLLLGLAALLTAGPVAHAAPAPPGQPSPFRRLLTTLSEPGEFPGFPDPGTTLQQALDRLAERHHLRFDVNDAAFEAEGLADVRATPVARTPLPPRARATPAEVLREVLARVPVPSGALYLVRRDHLEVTTARAARLEIFGDADRPLPPLVHVEFTRQLLGDALAGVARSAGYRLAIDPRVGEKVKTPVTATLRNVPADTAARLLADMAGLEATVSGDTLSVAPR